MLKLFRSIGESIFIGDEVKVSVEDVSGDRVKLGIVAPKEIAVHREEAHRRIFGADATRLVKKRARDQWIRARFTKPNSDRT